MKAKLLMLLLSLFFSSLQTFAQTTVSDILPSDTLIIRKIIAKDNSSTLSLTIGDINKRNGDIFIAGQEIIWDSNIKYIETRNKRNSKIVTIYNENATAPTPQGGNNILIKLYNFCKDIYNNYLIQPHTGTKGGNTKEEVKKMKEWLSQTFYMTGDNLYISSSLIVDNEHTYIFESSNDSKATSFSPLYNPDEPFIMLISKEELKEHNIDIDNKTYTFTVTYRGDGETSFITNSFCIKSINF